MALKFRRGTTAQKSGSLAVGEPYINYDLQTLQIGTDQGDVTLSTTSPTATSAVASISASNFLSASYLEIVNDANIKGNVTIGGTIQIGDNTSDTINVVASLSSSLIPQSDNTYDLGSLSKSWKDLYISTGSIKFVSAGTIVGSLSTNASGLQLTNDIYVASDGNTGVRVGRGAGSNTTFNTALGYAALNSNTTGQSNTAVGATALTSNKSGDSNVAVGTTALSFNEAGSDNTAVGTQALYKNAGYQNTAVGKETLFNSISGSGNTAVGAIALKRIGDNGGNNTAIGYLAGQYASGSSNSNVYIGNGAGPTASVEESGKLYINNAASNTPLIGGDFTQREIYVDGDIIPATTNARDLGSLTNIWRDLYISTGSIKMVSNGVVVSVLSNTGNGFALDQGITANGNSSFGTSSAAVTSVTGSLNVSGAVAVIGSVSASTITGIGNVTAYSSSVNSRVSSLESFSSSLGNGFATDAELGVVSASAWGAFQSASAYSASLATSISASKAEYTSFSASNATNDNTQTTNITAASASAWGAFQSASAYSASLATSISESNASAVGYSASAASALSSVSGAVATSLNNASSSAYSTFAKLNGDNTFTGTQIITGSLYISSNLIVQGSSSLQNITASAVSIGTNTVILNTNNPAVRYGGLSVTDSGSAAGKSGSLYFDSTDDEWIFVHQGNAAVTSSTVITGPETYDNLGNETHLTDNRLVKAKNGFHIVDSNISDTGTKVSISSDLDVIGAISSSTINGIGNVTLYSSSVDSRIITNANAAAGAFASASAYSSSAATSFSASLANVTAISSSFAANTITINGTAVKLGGTLTTAQTLAGAISSSAQVNGLSILYNSMSIAGTSTALGGTISAATIGNAIGAFSSSAQVNGTAIQNNSITINGTSVALGGTLTTAQTLAGAISSSAQVDHNSTTNYSANRHIDHTAVSITAGSGISGGGDISATRTLTLDTGSAHFLGGARGAISVSDTTGASGIDLTYNSGTGVLSGVLANSAITIAGSSTSLGGSISAATIGNAIGAFSGSAQVDLTATTNYGTYINQAVKTTSSPTFAGLTINGSITATGDITAYYTSDRRFKNNVQTIPNALDKVRALNGVTWDWAENTNDVTKAAPTTGLIAQEVQAVLPQVVKEKEDGFLGLDYSKMIGLLVEAIKEQQYKIDLLSAELEGLKTKD
jgi:hypothetical protein